MQIIPVLDLKAGAVVRALGGRRDAYRPIVTPLAASSAPDAVVAGFLHLHPFRAVYIADLDAITGLGDHRAVIADLASRFPGLRFWVDAGVRDEAQGQALLKMERVDAVLGSESLRNMEVARAFAREQHALLSLDFRGDDFLGPPELLATTDAWPARVIVMTLARVGAGVGPDLARLARIRAQAGGREIFAAGGVRDARDLDALARDGVACALVATALHDGAISAADLKRFA
jgi:HisA/HisF family protein